MIVFILSCLVLAALVQSHNQFLPLLATPEALGVGLALLVVSLLLGYLKKLPSLYWHDGFATAALIVWYAYWKPEFNDDAPMFFFFPVYFALLSGLVTLSLINKSQYFDVESVQNLRYLDKMLRIDMSGAVIFVLIGLGITRHYALYPMAMTFFITRHSIRVCLDNIDG